MKLRKVTPKVCRQIKNMREAGMRHIDIAEQVGLSDWTVSKILSLGGSYTKYYRFCEEMAEKRALKKPAGQTIGGAIVADKEEVPQSSNAAVRRLFAELKETNSRHEELKREWSDYLLRNAKKMTTLDNAMSFLAACSLIWGLLVAGAVIYLFILALTK